MSFLRRILGIQELVDAVFMLGKKIEINERFIDALFKTQEDQQAKIKELEMVLKNAMNCSKKKPGRKPKEGSVKEQES